MVASLIISFSSSRAGREGNLVRRLLRRDYLPQRPFQNVKLVIAHPRYVEFLRGLHRYRATVWTGHFRRAQASVTVRRSGLRRVEPPTRVLLRVAHNSEEIVQRHHA